MESMYSVWDAALYLESKLKGKTAKQLYGYLMNNPRNWREQDGFLVICHVIDGKLAYTEASLKAFIKAHQKPQGNKGHGRSKTAN